MAKRFTDTDKWKKPFIRSLEAPYKLLWFYILDDCDHAGIWQVDFEVACIRTGQPVSEKIAIQLFGDRVEIFDNGTKWFLRDFIFFQYGELNPKNRLHLSVINILTKHRVGAYKVLPRTQGQEQGNGQGTIQGHGEQIPKSELSTQLFSDEIYMSELSRAHPKKDLKQAFDEMYLHHSQSPNILEPWQWRQKFNTWLSIKGDSKPQNGKVTPTDNSTIRISDQPRKVHA